MKAKLKIRDRKRKLTLCWFGDNEIKAFDSNSREISSWSVDNSLREARKSMKLRIKNGDYP